MAKRFSITSQIGYVTAILIIMFAVLISAGRLLTPYLNEHLPDFEMWASRLLKTPVKITHVEISWDKYEPEIALKEVSICEPKTLKTQLTIQEIKVNLNIVKSILSWSPVLEKIKIQGTHLTVFQPLKGLPLIEELKGLNEQATSTETESHFGDIIGWFFTQNHFILRNIGISYHPVSQPVKSILIKRLILKNDADHHQLEGHVILNQKLPLVIHSNINWIGDLTDFEHISANIYIDLDNVSLPQWFSNYTWNHLKIERGVGSLKLWGNWNLNQLQKIQTQFQFYDLKAQSQEKQRTIEIPRFSGHIGWRKEKNKHIYSGNDILIDLPNHLWPAMAFQMMFSPDGQGNNKLESAHLSYLDLGDVQTIGVAASLFPEQINKVLLAVNPTGEVRNVTYKGDPTLFPNLLQTSTVKKNQANTVSTHSQIGNDKVRPSTSRIGNDNVHPSTREQFSLKMAFNHLSMHPWQDYPGFKNLTGDLVWHDTEGSLMLNSKNAGIFYPRFFSNEFLFDQLNTVVYWQQTKNELQSLSIENLKLQNKELIAQLKLNLAFSQSASPRIDLVGSFNLNDAGMISHYLPIKTYNPELITWLTHAFLKGQIESGKIVLQGKLSDFPFEKGNGIFQINSSLKNLTLKFDPQWPALTQLNGHLLFSQNSMTTEINSAKILDVNLSSIHGIIPSLSKGTSQLQIHGFAQSRLEDVVELIQKSSLQNTLGNDLKNLNPSGAMGLKLGLNIPLGRAEEITLQGDLTVNDALLKPNLGHLVFDQLKGTLHFTEKNLQATGLQGRLLNAPATMNITTVQGKGKEHFLKATLQSQLNIEALQTWLGFPLSHYAKGVAPYQLEFYPASYSQMQSSKIIMKTDLKGIEINLPSLYLKKAEQSAPLSLAILTSSNKPLQIKLQYDNVLSAALNFQKNEQEMQFYSGEVHLGLGEASFPKQSGLMVTAKFNRLEWDTLQPYFSLATQTADKSQEKNSFSMDFKSNMFRKLMLTAKTLHVLGQDLNNAHVEVSKIADRWAINLSSTQVVGKMMVFDTFKNIQAQFQRFHLKPTKEKVKNVIEPRLLPTLTINADDVVYGDFALGHVMISTVPSLSGLRIQQLQLNNDMTQINATGTWEGDKRSMSHLEGQLKTSKINKTLEQWGINVSSLIGTDALVMFDLNWPEAPYSPSLKNIMGTLTVNLGHGRIVNLSGSTEAKMGIGRMLSVFSLQSIPRRLSLDFSDLFHNGYSFDRIKGNFKLKNGSAYTTDLRFEGPVASINLAGRIGFQAKDYDLNLGVTTYMTSSLWPVFAWLGGPIPGIAGTATWAVSTALNQVSSKVSTYQYSITGSWSDPEWRQLDTSKVSLPLQPAR